MYEFIKNNVESSDKIFLDAPNRNPLSFNELHQKLEKVRNNFDNLSICLLYTSPSPRDKTVSRMPSSA